MKKTIFYAILIAFFFCANTTVSTAQSIQEKYDKETIYLTNLKYVKNGVKYPMGFSRQNLKKELEVSPNAMAEWGNYKKNQAAYLSLYGVGLASLVAGILVDEKNDELRGGLIIGSAAMFTVSLPFALNAQKSLHKAVWLRNRDVLE